MTGAIPTIQQENEIFENALRAIENGGKSVKKGFQTAVRCTVKAILYRQDTGPANMLDNKLSGMESNHYKKMFRANLAAYCGWFDTEIDTKGQNRFYYKDSKESPVIFSKEKGRKGWQINGKIPATCKENYEKYFNSAHFAELKIEKRIEKKTYTQKVENKAKEILDFARAVKALPEDTESWAAIAPEWQAVIEHISKLITD